MGGLDILLRVVKLVCLGEKAEMKDNTVHLVISNHESFYKSLSH